MHRQLGESLKYATCAPIQCEGTRAAMERGNAVAAASRPRHTTNVVSWSTPQFLTSCHGIYRQIVLVRTPSLQVLHSRTRRPCWASSAGVLLVDPHLLFEGALVEHECSLRAIQKAAVGPGPATAALGLDDDSIGWAAKHMALPGGARQGVFEGRYAAPSSHQVPPTERCNAMYSVKALEAIT